MSNVLGMAGTVFNWILYLALAAAFYYACAAPLHRIAGKRGIRCPWLAWIPVIWYFYLLAVADDVARKRRRPARLLAQGLITAGILAVLIVIGAVTQKANPLAILSPILLLIVSFSPLYVLMQTFQALVSLAQTAALLDTALSILPLLAGVAILVTLHMALYKLYSEYKPHSALAFTALGVLTPIAIPIFLFLIRGESARSQW